MDLFSRLIVSWAAGPTIHRELVLNAVLSAVRRRRPRGTLIHSDHPVRQRRVVALLPLESPRAEYEPERQLLGHAVAESFFSSLKKERIKKQIYNNRELAIADIAHYIDSFCNSTRRHTHLGGVSPEQFESVHKPLRKGLH